MSFINGDHPGLAYGDGYMAGAGAKGQVVKVDDNDKFAVNIDPAARSFGILRNDYEDGKMPGIWCNGGIYTTDVFEGTITAGDALCVSVNGKLIAVAGSEIVIAEAISVNGGVLKFKLLI